MVLIDLSPLKYCNFRRLYLSQFISMLGSQMTMVTIPFQVYALTKSTFQTGLVSAVELVCLVVTALWGGAIADKLDRRKIIIFSEITMLILVLIMAANSLLNTPNLWLIYILAGIVSGINGFHRPAFEALTPVLVPKNDLAKISSLISFKFVVASLIGPMIAGFLVANFGPFFTYIIDASSFILSLIFLFAISGVNFQANASSKSSQIFKEVIDGGSYIYSRKDILGSYVVDFFAMVFCMPQVLFPAFAEKYAMNSWLGILYASVAIGGLVATLFSRWTPNVKRLGMAITFSAAGWAFSIFCVGIIPFFWIIPVGLFFAGMCDCYSGIFRMTMWNESLPDNYRGRVASFGMLSYTSGPLLGNALMGFLGDLIGLRAALAFGGMLSLLSILFVLFFLPAFWKYSSK